MVDSALPRYPSKALLPALAAQISIWFPELEGRAIAVSEESVTKENMPTLPVCTVALLRETGNDNVATDDIQPEEEFFVSFWFKPVRYTRADGSDTPFWAYYDYETLRDRFLTQLKNWRSPRNEPIKYMELTVQSDHFAVIVTFRLRHKFIFCPIDDTIDPCTPTILREGLPAQVDYHIVPAESPCC